MAKSDDAAKAPAGKGKLKLILLIVVGLLLAIGASVGGTWYIMHSSASKPAPAAETAKLTDSVAPAVITNTSPTTPSVRAMRDLASAYSRRTCTLGAYGLDGLKNRSEKYGRIASNTTGSTGVAAAWSR